MTTSEQARADAHECSACSGSGIEGWEGGSGCPGRCFACDGAGHISDRMPAADAMADARTLWHEADRRGTLDPISKALGNAATYGDTVASLLQRVWPQSELGSTVLVAAAGAGAEKAARAAFRAVPGLRS